MVFTTERSGCLLAHAPSMTPPRDHVWLLPQGRGEDALRCSRLGLRENKMADSRARWKVFEYLHST